MECFPSCNVYSLDFPCMFLLAQKASGKVQTCVPCPCMLCYRRPTLVHTCLCQVDELQASQSYISREEQELRDVEREMEEQLNQQHSLVCVFLIMFYFCYYKSRWGKLFQSDPSPLSSIKLPPLITALPWDRWSECSPRESIPAAAWRCASS